MILQICKKRSRNSFINIKIVIIILEEKIVLNGRMTFININFQGNDESVIGLFDRSISLTNRFTYERLEIVEQLNLIKYLKDELEVYSREIPVTIRYVVSDKPITDAETLTADIITQLDGGLIMDHTAHYSESIGYLYLTQEMKVGGHDLLKELESHMVCQPKDPGYSWRWLKYEDCPEKYL